MRVSTWMMAAVLGSAAHAQEYLSPPALASPINDSFALRADYFWDRVDTFGRFDSKSGIEGTPFSPERDLGLADRSDQPAVELMFRLRDRNRLRVNLFDLRRTAERRIDRTLQYGDLTFAVNDPVKSELDWRQIDFTYTYSFLRTERFELGAGAALHLIQAEATAEIPRTANRADYNGAAPYATIAVDGTWQIDRHWSFNARGQYLHLHISDAGGLLGIYHADVQYRWKRNFALGVGYQSEQIEIDITKQDPSGVMRMHISGPEAFARVSF